ncbi:SDR family NAD(P)-dependent oxidoreductase [Candidatus Poriferisodalis sp.]|uniref:SDR family NAD(P)-dependent oxidoreductase n=1 Tax=Candidatus Poriferisodalis sp. TaxID=3101277 RepID=UPI003D10FDFC
MTDNGNADRVALVTGGGRGIGREICLGLARDGRRVAVADLRVPEATETAAAINAERGGESARAIAVPMDVADSDSVTQGLVAVADELGPVEVLVNCAGWDELRPFGTTDEDFWDRVIEINYKGPLRTTHGCLPAMIEAGFGRIVNIGSDAGRVGSSGEAVYSGAKGGVIAFTKTIAREVARRGITANVVCPGPTDTPLLEEIASATDTSDKIIGAMARAVPMKRIGQPHEVASAVVYLCSEEAGFITGQTLSVSGGLTMA